MVLGLTAGLCLLLCLLGDGRCLSTPSNVHFVAETIRHVLHWDPGVNTQSSGRRYEVQYLRYGSSPWTAAPTCTGITARSCDLTYETRDVSQRYYARVRAVSGTRRSSWAQASPFRPEEAALRLSGVSLSVTDNVIHVSLKLPERRWGNETVSYKDIHRLRESRQYRVHGRRWSDNQQFVFEGSSEEFDIPELLWGECYCLSVEPRITSRSNQAVRSKEQCVTITAKDKGRLGILTIATMALLVLLTLGILGALFICAYVRRPVTPPTVLKSLLKHSSTWVMNELSLSAGKDVVVCLREDSIQQLALDQKLSLQDGSAERPALPSPEKAPPKGQGWAGRQGDVMDSSCSSVDSGICVQGSSCSFSQLPSSELQALPGSSDKQSSSSINMESPGGREYKAPNAVELESGWPASGGSLEHGEFPGYLQQPRGAVERVLGPTPSTKGANAGLELGPVEPALANGYLKQASPRLQPGPAAGLEVDTLLPAQPGGLGFACSRFDCRDLGLLGFGEAETPGPAKSLPDFPPAPFVSLGGFYPVRAFSANAPLTVEISSLSLLDARS
uniref:Interleukin 10 receptor subunit alpha n=1 Tax=Sphenodon punctatus TaxID=8508 RepID=A0A8D0L3Q4_SPHPU